MKNLISWFEIPVNGFPRARKFYETILGITIKEQMVGQALMGFFSDNAEEGVSGALVKHEWYVPSDRGVMIYLNGGDDLQPMLAKVEAAGGKILMPKTAISSEIGFMAAFLDTEGNRISLYSKH